MFHEECLLFSSVTHDVGRCLSVNQNGRSSESTLPPLTSTLRGGIFAKYLLRAADENFQMFQFYY